MLIVGSIGAMAPKVLVRSAAAQDIQTAIEKANLYIEVAKLSERAVDSWERYASWVNMKTGPTGLSSIVNYPACARCFIGWSDRASRA
jgi:hypothetical protein